MQEQVRTEVSRPLNLCSSWIRTLFVNSWLPCRHLLLHLLDAKGLWELPQDVRRHLRQKLSHKLVYYAF
jgi:hypothetical protein